MRMRFAARLRLALLAAMTPPLLLGCAIPGPIHGDIPLPQSKTGDSAAGCRRTPPASITTPTHGIPMNYSSRMEDITGILDATLCPCDLSRGRERKRDRTRLQ